MAQTFKDFIVECEMYPYSKENFEIIKECEEISLLSKMLENHYVLQELNLDSVQLEYTSYMEKKAEPVGAEKTLVQNIKEKIISLLNKVKRVIISLLERLVRFLQKKANRLKISVLTSEDASWAQKNPEKVIDAFNKKYGGNAVKVVKAPPKFKATIPQSIRGLLAANAAMNDSVFTESREPAVEELLKLIRLYSPNGKSAGQKADIKDAKDMGYEGIESKQECPISMESLAHGLENIQRIITLMKDALKNGKSGSGIEEINQTIKAGLIDQYLGVRKNYTYYRMIAVNEEYGEPLRITEGIMATEKKLKAEIEEMIDIIRGRETDMDPRVLNIISDSLTTIQSRMMHAVSTACTLEASTSIYSPKNVAEIIRSAMNDSKDS